MLSSIPKILLTQPIGGRTNLILVLPMIVFLCITMSIDLSVAFQSAPPQRVPTLRRIQAIGARDIGHLSVPKPSSRSAVIHLYSIHDNNEEMLSNETGIGTQLKNVPSSRRQALQFMATSAAALSLSPLSANAGKAEIDSKSGQLFSPKNQMLGGGGSDLARGLKLESKNRQAFGFGANGAPIQFVYETRFITYLSRFLLNYDPAAKTWWGEQDFSGNAKVSGETQKKLRFAEFAESVEVGLAAYFVGPYGSYASVQAAKAGLLANAPAISSSSGVGNKKTSLFDSLKGRMKNKTSQSLEDNKAKDNARQGILNLCSLLQARYMSPKEKRQLAIMFALISDPNLQPTKEIKGLLGEADNGRLSGIELVGFMEEGDNYRGSSHHGGGYSMYEIPKVTIDSPPGLGASFKPAKIEVTTKPTSRVLRIRVLDGGRGYTSIPEVLVIQNGVKVPCEATAILDRNGSVESVIVLDPGYGYGKYNRRTDIAPEVRIASPKKPLGTDNKSKDKYLTAIAIADLEFAIDAIKIVDGGNGYILNQPPNAAITPPAIDADWYMSPIDRLTWRANDIDQVGVKVVSMIRSNTGETVDVNTGQPEELDLIGSYPSILNVLAGDPLSLLPSSLCPHFTASGDQIPELGARAGKNGNYRILSLPETLPTMILPSPRYRAFDPVFGAIGSKPVTISAQALTGSEYSRLALSGGICTVIVRTALNPLELVKTKIQLKNDNELMKAIAKKSSPAVLVHEQSKPGQAEDVMEEEVKPGTLDIIKALISMRGPQSLFQSADVTFLASVVFGTLGFGATELFRRSFTMIYFPENTGGMRSTGEELIVLVAAALACILTSLVAAPFEILRVRSMGYVEAKPVSQVLSDFLVSSH